MGCIFAVGEGVGLHVVFVHVEEGIDHRNAAGFWGVCYRGNKGITHAGEGVNAGVGIGHPGAQRAGGPSGSPVTCMMPAYEAEGPLQELVCPNPDTEADHHARIDGESTLRSAMTPGVKFLMTTSTFGMSSFDQGDGLGST